LTSLHAAHRSPSVQQDAASLARLGERIALAVPERLGGKKVDNGALFRPEVPDKPNGFKYELTGHAPPVAAGSLPRQIFEGWKTAGLSVKAMESVQSHHRFPSDARVSERLAGMSFTPLLGDPKTVTVATYASRVPGASGRELYDAFVADPGSFLKGGHLAARPAPTAGLKDGMRLMMEDQSFPPLWMPVQVKLDPKNQSVTFHTLTGHALRGFNRFTFKSDGEGNAVVDQLSRFQGSSALTTIGSTLIDAMNHQHDTWKGVHNAIYDLKAGDLDQVA